MDTRSFDALIRRLAQGAGRRQTLLLLATALFAAVLGRAPGVEAGCKKVGKKCDKNKDCCDGAKCKGGKCKCKSGFSKCNKKCFDLNKDENHCGSCDIACGAGETCCSGACVDLQNDTSHCGACNNVCSENEGCLNGVCRCVPITPAFASSRGSCSSSSQCCDGGTCCTFDDVDGPQSSCFDLLTHETACGTTCENIVNCFGGRCINGVCFECPAGADHCASSTSTCEDSADCHCLKRFANGAPVCAIPPPDCDEKCNSDADCPAFGFFCASGGDNCCPNSAGQGRCARLCTLPA